MLAGALAIAAQHQLDGVVDADAARVGVVVAATLVSFTGILLSLALAAAVSHILARFMGARVDVRTGTTAFLLAAAPWWLRNTLLGLALGSGMVDDPRSLAGLQLGDPFLLVSGVFLFVALRQVHRLSAPRAGVVASVVTIGGVALNVLSWAG